MEVKKNGTQGSQKGPEEYFTGNVRIDPLSQAHEPSRMSCALVTFEPGTERTGRQTIAHHAASHVAFML